MNNTPTPLTDSEIDDLVNRLSHTAEDHLHWCCRATVLDTIELIKELKLERDKLERELNEAKHDIESYRGALGYSIAGTHDGKLTDGTTPQCGMCNSEYRKSIEAERDKLERELNEARETLEVTKRAYAIVIAERDEAGKENAQLTAELDVIKSKNGQKQNIQIES